MTTRHPTINRRQALTALGLSGAATLGITSTARAVTELTQTEAANIDLVNAMCATWVAPMNFSKLGELLSDDCIYRATETAPPVSGRDAIIERLQGLGQSSFIEFEVIETFARGSIVVNDRIDRFDLPNRKIEWHGVGVFYIKDGKIAEWSDFTIL
jgi:limonene-1,2-epoxide hydrolase